MGKLTSKEGCKDLAEQCFRAEICMKANIETTKGMVGEGLFGQMVLTMMACGRME